MPTPDIGGQYIASRNDREKQAALSELMLDAPGQAAAADTPHAADNSVPPVTLPKKAAAYLDPYEKVLLPAAKDIAKGVTETPRAVLTGVHDAIKNTYGMADEFSRWAGDKIGKTTGVYGWQIGGDEGSQVYRSAEERDAPHPGTFDAGAAQDAVRDEMNTPSMVANPKSVTGGLVKGVTQFVAGMAMTSKALGVLPELEGAGGYAVDRLKNAAAAFAAFDPHQGRLSNLIERYPVLSNPITRYLASKPGEGEAEGRFKNSLDAILPTAVADGLLRAVKLARASQDVRATADNSVPPVEVPRQLAPDAFKAMGNEAPNAAFVKKASAGTKVKRNGQPTVVYHGTATDFGDFSAGQKEGYWFTENPKYAGLVADAKADPELNDGVSGAANIRPAFLSIRNPATIEQLESEGMESLVAKGYDGAHDAKNGQWVAFDKAQIKSTVGLSPDDFLKAEGDVPRETFINFARIDAPEDVKRVMQRLADVGVPAADEARAGVRGFEEVKLDAAHQDAWQTLLARRPGQPLSDAEGLAARQLWVSTTDKMAELAETAATQPSEANLFAFRKMLDIHDMVQREVLGARASTARALAAWRIPAGGGAERLANVTAALEASGGNDVSRALAARVASLAKAGMIKEMGAVAEKGAYATTRDAVVEAWINGLLTNPVTHVANTVSNLTVLPLRMAERAVASKIGELLGDQGVAAGEAAAQWAGAMQGFRDMFRYYTKVAKDLLPQDSMVPNESGAVSPLSQLNLPQLTKLEHPPSISSEAFHISSDTLLGRGVDLLGSTIRAPGFALNASDEFFKTIGYRMEVGAQAVRQATSEVASGLIDGNGFKARVAELIENPPENIRLAAGDAALYQTFNQAPGMLGKTLGKLTSAYPALKVILPFTRTPSNILNFTFERTPLAPLMSKFRADVAAGGSRRDLALAQMALGSMTMATAVDAVMSGQITGRGPLDHGIRDAMTREGWQPYSFKVGDRWYSYNRLDPVGSLLGMAADATELMTNAQHEALEEGDTEKLRAAVAASFASNITNKTYLSGLSSTFAALNEPQRADSWLQRAAGSVVPAGVAQIERLQDPVQREVYSMMNAIRARTPGLSKEMGPVRDLWGEPVRQDSGLGKPFDAFSPIYSKNTKHSPIDDEILKQGFNISMPIPRQTFKTPGGEPVSVDLSKYPRAYSRLLQLSGHEIESPAWGVGLKDLLNSIVDGTHPLSQVYAIKSDGPEGGKETMIRHLIGQYRDLAKAQLLDEYPSLRSEVEDKSAAKAALQLPQ